MWHSRESDVTTSAQAAILYNECGNNTIKITATSPRGNALDQGMYIPDSNIHTALAGGRDLQGYNWQYAFVVGILQA